MSVTTVGLNALYTKDVFDNLAPLTDHDEALFNGAKVRKGVKTCTLDVVGGAATVSTSGTFIPAGACNVMLVGRITTAVVLGGGGVNFDVGISGAATRFAENIALAAGTVIQGSTYLSTVGLFNYPAGAEVLLTPDAGTFTSGVLRLTIFYDLPTAPTS